MCIFLVCHSSGLTPNTTYRVTVRSKNIKAPHFDEKGSKQMEKLSAHTEFKTLPKGKLIAEGLVVTKKSTQK